MAQDLVHEYLSMINTIAKAYHIIPICNQMSIDRVQIRFISARISDDKQSRLYLKLDELWDDLYGVIPVLKPYFEDYLELEATEETNKMWEELLMKNFTKKDLKNGDFVELRNGMIGAVIVDADNIVLNSGGFMEISGYNDDLTNKPGPFGRDNNYDIMKVYRGDRSFRQIKTVLHGAPIYDRNLIETVEEMTLEEVCKALGKNIKIVKG